MTSATSKISINETMMFSLNEAAHIQACLIIALQALRDHAEIIIVDGGSHDNTVALATPYADKVLQSGQGRAKQMNHGAWELGESGHLYASPPK